MTQLAVGMTAITAAATLALQSVLPNAPPITINSLRYDAGQVIQDRTIATDGQAFYAQWAVTVENAETGESLIWCEGNGANAYPPGTRAVVFSLQDWTGRDECTADSLPPGVYALRGSWRWGEDWTSAKSLPFEVME